MIALNLLPWRESVQRRRLMNQGLVIFLGLLAGFIIWMPVHSWLKQAVSQQLLKQQSLEQQLKFLQQKWESYYPMGDTREAVFQNDYQFIQQDHKAVLQFLQQLAESIPPALRLEQLQFDKNTWVVSGVAANVPAVLQLNDRLVLAKTPHKLRPNVLDIKAKDPVFYFQLKIQPSRE